MSLSYPFKRLIRSWRLFIALLLGIVLASTFFGGINVGADTAARQALEQTLSQIPVDIVVEPSYYIYGYQSPNENVFLSSKNVLDTTNSISNLNGVTDAEAISNLLNYNFNSNLTINRVIGITEHSRNYEGLKELMPSPLQENETLVSVDSAEAGKIHVGNVFPINVTATSWNISGGNYVRLSFIVNLTVVGFVNLSEQAVSIAMGQYYGYSGGFYPQPTIFITSWEKTIARLMDAMYNFSAQDNPIGTTILVFVDRSSMISPWDPTSSATRLDALTAQINEKVSPYGLAARNNLSSALSSYQGTSLAMRFAFIIAALPVFFVAWYMGSTVSDVSFNLRRREIGLLMTKGFSKRQLFLMFILESTLIGLIGGALGIILSFTLSPWFVEAAGGQFVGTPIIGPESIVLTIIFAVIITFLSAYRPARRASNMTTVDALREYMYVEDVKPHRQLLPWAALILGSFKIIVFILGINFQAEMIRLGAPTNILVFVLLSIVTALDAVLTYIGPFLFFWGFTKIFIRGSLKFQQITARVARFLGDLGELATKSVQRNPARVAAVAFLIAFIIGYSVQIVGTLASEQDFGVRAAHFQVGSDISLTLNTPTNATQIMNTIRINVTHIQSLTAEYSFQAGTGIQNYGSMMVKAIDPEAWPSTAYYEDEMFSGNSAKTAFQSLASNNDTIILERNTAEILNKHIGDTVAVTFSYRNIGDQTEMLKVVGFFGKAAPQISGQPVYYYSQYWSYVPEGLYRKLNQTITDSSTAVILIRLESDVDSEVVVDKIRDLNIGYSSLSSVDEQLKEAQSNVVLTGPLNILRLGVVFMVLAASVGTALVTLVSLRERRREASIMSVRGLSFKQLLVMLLTENFAIVTFAVLLGAIVGLIAVYGTIASTNSQPYNFSPLSRHMVFPTDALLTLAISFTLVFASTIIPVMIMAKRYSSRLDRTVREV